ncbi:MAG: hypothetical protein AB7U20_18980 [Planctomycetaceae bacterium]
MHTASLTFLTVAVLLSTHPALAQEADEASEIELNTETETPPPRDNSEFVGVTTTAKVTRRFEMYNPHSREALETLKDMGFTQVILDWPNLHPDATEVGLDVVLANWWTDKTAQDEIDRALTVAREVEQGCLAGISVMDEPERNSPDTPFGYYVELYNKLRPQMDRELPGVRLEISHWGPLASWDQRYYDYFSYLYEAADVMRIMPFPDLHEGPLGDVYLMMARSREVMKIAERELPLVVILQTWVLPPRSALPEIAELRVMAWQALLGGAETISFFDYNQEIWSQSPGFHDRFVELMHELTSASHRLRDATIESALDEHGIVSARVAWPSGRTHIIRVNTNRTSVSGLEPLAIVESQDAGQLAVRRPQRCTHLRACACAGPTDLGPPRVRQSVVTMRRHARDRHHAAARPAHWRHSPIRCVPPNGRPRYSLRR